MAASIMRQIIITLGEARRNQSSEARENALFHGQARTRRKYSRKRLVAMSINGGGMKGGRRA